MTKIKDRLSLMISVIINLSLFNISEIKSNSCEYFTDSFLDYWRSLVFALPTKTKLILGLVREKIMPREYLLKILLLDNKNKFNEFIDSEKKVMTVLRYLSYGKNSVFGDYDLVTIMENLCIDHDFFNPQNSFMQHEERKRFKLNEKKILDFTFISLDLQKYLKNINNDNELVLLETERAVETKNKKFFFRELENFYDDLEILIKTICVSKIDLFIKIYFLKALVFEDRLNLKIILKYLRDEKILGLFFESLISDNLMSDRRKDDSDEFLSFLKNNLNNLKNFKNFDKKDVNLDIKEIGCFLKRLTNLDVKTFYELFEIERRPYEPKKMIKNCLKRHLREENFDEISKFEDEKFLKEFFEIAEPSISHFLVYFEILQDEISKRFAKKKFKEKFYQKIIENDNEREIYKEILVKRPFY